LISIELHIWDWVILGTTLSSIICYRDLQILTKISYSSEINLILLNFWHHLRLTVSQWIPPQLTLECQYFLDILSWTYSLVSAEFFPLKIICHILYWKTRSLHKSLSRHQQYQQQKELQWQLKTLNYDWLKSHFSLAAKSTDLKLSHQEAVRAWNIW